MIMRDIEAELLLECYNILRCSLRQHFSALLYAVKWFSDNSLGMQLEFNDIADLDLTITSPIWQKLILEAEIQEQGSLMLITEENLATLWNRNAVLHRVILRPGIHNYLYKNIHNAIAMACFFIKQADRLPWNNPPWFETHGITIWHGEDIIILLKHKQVSPEKLIQEIISCKRKRIKDLEGFWRADARLNLAL